MLKDITSGALRRKRGAADDLDLSDSDDERMMAKRREKRREFAKMRKALLADEKIGKIAEDPKKVAFLRTIEDRDMDKEVDVGLFEESSGGAEENSSSQDTQNGNPNMVAQGERAESALGNSNKRKRPLEHSASGAYNRPPHLRRTVGPTSKKPSTLAEIRESVSSLIDDPSSESFSSVAEELSDEENAEFEPIISEVGEDGSDNREMNVRSSQMPEVTYDNPRRSRGKVVDRLSLRRAASSNAASAATGARKAFYSATREPEFKRPAPLLRRVTANSTVSNGVSSTSGVVTGVASTSFMGINKATTTTVEAAGGVKKGTAVNSYAAARERQREWELKRGRKEEKRTDLKPAGVGLGRILGGGSWE